MTNMIKNYYEILQVNEQCTNDELKSAYRKLARKWHPDVAGNTAEAVSKFKEINEAYEVLSDKVKRADYDRMNRFYNYSSTKKATGNTTEPNFKNTNTQQKNLMNTNHQVINLIGKNFYPNTENMQTDIKILQNPKNQSAVMQKGEKILIQMLKLQYQKQLTVQ